jgi:hypothetical protein
MKALRQLAVRHPVSCGLVISLMVLVSRVTGCPMPSSR